VGPRKTSEPAHEDPVAEDGTVTRIGDDLVLRFERDLGHSIGKVWAALTDPSGCARWLGEFGGVPGRECR
jgi:uncharacterized protein YndB with AHSA1/START domain